MTLDGLMTICSPWASGRANKDVAVFSASTTAAGCPPLRRHPEISFSMAGSFNPKETPGISKALASNVEQQ